MNILVQKISKIKNESQVNQKDQLQNHLEDQEKNQQQNHPKSTRKSGAEAECCALIYLQNQGLILLERNYRAPKRTGSEIDLIMLDPFHRNTHQNQNQNPNGNENKNKNETLVFVEVRKRSSLKFGGAASSIDWRKQQRIIFAAEHYLQRFENIPACRFDALLFNPRAEKRQRAAHVENENPMQNLQALYQIEWIIAAFDS